MFKSNQKTISNVYLNSWKSISEQSAGIGSCY